jgi:hypothetical protein
MQFENPRFCVEGTNRPYVSVFDRPQTRRPEYPQPCPSRNGAVHGNPDRLAASKAAELKSPVFNLQNLIFAARPLGVGNDVACAVEPLAFCRWVQDGREAARGGEGDFCRGGGRNLRPVLRWLGLWGSPPGTRHRQDRTGSRQPQDRPSGPRPCSPSPSAIRRPAEVPRGHAAMDDGGVNSALTKRRPDGVPCPRHQSHPPSRTRTRLRPPRRLLQRVLRRLNGRSSVWQAVHPCDRANRPRTKRQGPTTRTTNASKSVLHGLAFKPKTLSWSVTLISAKFSSL